MAQVRILKFVPGVGNARLTEASDSIQLASLGVGVSAPSTSGLLAFVDASPTAVGQIGMNATNGRPRAFIRGASQELIYLSDTLYELFLVSTPTTPNNNYSQTITSNLVTQEKWLRASDSSKLKTIDYTYSSGKVSTEVTKVYATDGVTIVAQTTATYTYGASITYALTRDV